MAAIDSRMPVQKRAVILHTVGGSASSDIGK